MIVHTEGLILKSMDYRETSKIVTVFTKEHGKMKGVLKGIRRDSRKFGSCADKLSVNSIVYYRYSRSDLHLISKCDMIANFSPDVEDYRRRAAAHYLLDLINLSLPVEEPNPRIYALVRLTLKHLEDVEDIDKLIHIFQVKFLHLSGFRPHLDSCVMCRKDVHRQAHFSVSLGGVICPQEAFQDTQCFQISRGTIQSLLFIEKNPIENSLRLGLTQQSRREIKRILNQFLIHHLHTNPRSVNRYQLVT